MEIITAEQAAEAAKGLTFEKVWAALMEMKKSQVETHEEMKKSLEESQKNMEKTVSNLVKNLGGLGNSLGQVIEAMFTAELWKKFSDLGFPVTRQSKQAKFCDEKRVLAEVDLFIENGEYAILVEIKTNMSIEHVDDHLERIEIVRKYLDGRNDSRKLLGAVAGGIVPDNVLRYAQKKGLYVVVQAGDAITIADMPHGFKPREW